MKSIDWYWYECYWLLLLLLLNLSDSFWAQCCVHACAFVCWKFGKALSFRSNNNTPSPACWRTDGRIIIGITILFKEMWTLIVGAYLMPYGVSFIYSNLDTWKFLNISSTRQWERWLFGEFPCWMNVNLFANGSLLRSIRWIGITMERWRKTSGAWWTRCMLPMLPLHAACSRQKAESNQSNHRSVE